MKIQIIKFILTFIILTPAAISASSSFCIKNGGTPEEIKIKIVELLNSKKISFRETSDGKIQILAQSAENQMNKYAEEVKHKFGARVLIAPSDMICGAAAVTNPADVCNLTVNLGYQAFIEEKYNTTLIHEAKHLEQVAPQTNGGFDSLFFGRISNLDNTDHSFYSTFSLDEITAYSTGMEKLLTNEKDLDPSTFNQIFGYTKKEMEQLVNKSSAVINQYLKFINYLDHAKGISVVKSDNGGVFIGDISKVDSPGIVYNSIDWRNSGKVNTVSLLNGHYQLTIPLFDSRLNIS